MWCSCHSRPRSFWASSTVSSRRRRRLRFRRPYSPPTYSAAIVSLGDLVEGGVDVLHETEGEPWSEGDGGAQRGGEVNGAK